MDRELISSDAFIKRVMGEIDAGTLFWPTLLKGLFLRYEYLFDTDCDNLERWNELVEILNIAWDDDHNRRSRLDTKFFSYTGDEIQNVRKIGHCQECKTVVIRKDGQKAKVRFLLLRFPKSLMRLLDCTQISDISVEKVAEILQKCVCFEGYESCNDIGFAGCTTILSPMLKKVLEETVVGHTKAIGAESILWANVPEIDSRGNRAFRNNRMLIYFPLWGVRNQLPVSSTLVTLALPYGYTEVDPCLFEWVMGIKYYNEHGLRNTDKSITLEGNTLLATYIPLINNYSFYASDNYGNNTPARKKRPFTLISEGMGIYDRVLGKFLECVKRMTDGEVILCISYEKGEDNALWGECLKQIMDIANIHTILRLPYGFSEHRISRPIKVGDNRFDINELKDLATDIIFISKGDDKRCRDKRYDDKVVWVCDLRTRKPKVKCEDSVLEYEIKNFYKWFSRNRRSRVNGENRWDSIRWKDIEEAGYRLDLDLLGFKGESKVSLSYDLKSKILALKSEEKKELLGWMADQIVLTDSGLSELKKTVEYQKFKELFFRGKGLSKDTAPMELLAEMAKDVGKKKSDAYSGGGVLDRAGFRRLKTGERKRKKLYFVHFAVKLGLNDDYARLLFESAGYYLTEQDAINIKRGKNNDLSYLDDYKDE